MPFYFDTNKETADPLVVRDEAFMRGYLTSAINGIKINTCREPERLETRERAAESDYLSNPSDEGRADGPRAQTVGKEAHVEAAHRPVSRCV